MLGASPAPLSRLGTIRDPGLAMIVAAMRPCRSAVVRSWCAPSCKQREKTYEDILARLYDAAQWQIELAPTSRRSLPSSNQG
jgi:hypothetical protein